MQQAHKISDEKLFGEDPAKVAEMRQRSFNQGQHDRLRKFPPITDFAAAGLEPTAYFVGRAAQAMKSN